jgi:glycosyltransferase involved in cell wall biosynthesis
MPKRPIRLLAFIEALTITGPAKNLLQFAGIAGREDFDGRVEVSIAVFQRPGQPEVFLDAARRLSLPVYPIPEKGRFDRAVREGMSSLVRRVEPDLVQSHAVKSHFLVRQAGIHRLVPWVVFHHGYTWTNRKVRLYNQLDRWSLRAAAQVLTVSQPFLKELTGKGVAAGRIEVIHNAIDPQWGRAARAPEAADALRKQLNIPPHRKVVLIVGRLSLEKDHITLARAVSQLKGVEPHLLIVGEGPERPAIERSVQELGLSDAVTFTGQVPSAEPYYGIADVAALSSLTEGSPNALLEAMAAGIPVVATAVGGIPEIVSQRESALLVGPRDTQAMSAALQELLTDAGLTESLSRRAYELVLSRHTPELRARRLSEIYARVSASHKR